MSGGSFNYMYTHVKPLTEYPLERMATLLEGLEWAGSAGAETRRCLRLIEEADAVAETLTDVWHAIEWWYSGDWNQADAREVVEPWRPPETITHVGPDPAQKYRLIDIGNGRYELRPVD